MNKLQKKTLNQLKAIASGTNFKGSIDSLLATVIDLPESYEILTKIGVRFFNDKKYSQAAIIFQRLHETNSENLKILEYCGITYLQLGMFEISINFFKKLVGKDNSNYEAWTNLCFAAGKSNNYTDAAFYAMQALTLRPTESKSHQNMGSVMWGLGRTNDALISFQTALELDPNNISALSNIANIYGEADQPEKALEIYNSCLEMLQPSSVLFEDIKYRMSFQYLKLGKLKEGWDCYEYGLNLTDVSSRTPKRKFKVPKWNGEPLNGKKLMIWREQGLGDEILFYSIVADLLKSNNDVIIECDPRLVTSLKRSFPNCEVRTQAFYEPPNSLPLINDFDFHIPVGSLAKFYRSQLCDFSSAKPYLIPNSTIVGKLLARLPKQGKRKIGICWRSGKLSAKRNDNYTSLSSWESIFSLKDVDFINLQYSDCEDELLLAEKHFGVKIHRWPDIDLTNDLDTLVSLISTLDHVISANTSVAEITLATGTPLSTFRKKHNAWDMLGQEKYPWYPLNEINHYYPLSGQSVEIVLPRIASDLSK